MTEEGAWVLELQQHDFLVTVPCSPGCGSPGDCTSHNRQLPNEGNVNCCWLSPGSGQRLLVAFHALLTLIWELQAAFHDFITNLHGIIHPRVLSPGSLSQTTFPYKHLAFICCATGSSPFAAIAWRAVTLHSHIPDTVPSCTTPGTHGRPDSAQPRPWALPARAAATAETEEVNSAFTSKTVREISLGSTLEESSI